MGLSSIFVSLIKRNLVTLFIEMVMRSLESVIQVFGERARSAADLGEVCEVILEDVPYFYQQGLLTAEVLCQYFPLERLAAHHIFVQGMEDTLVVEGIQGNYLVLGGTVLQQEPLAYGFFLSDTHATVVDGQATFLGRSTGVLQGHSEGHAYQQAKVSAREQATLTLHDEAIGVITELATGYAADACSVQVSGQGRLFVKGGAFFFARHQGWVSASEQAFGVVCDHVELVCEAGNWVVPLDTTVSVQAPEQHLIQEMPATKALWDEVFYLSASSLPVTERKEALSRLLLGWS